MPSPQTEDTESLQDLIRRQNQPVLQAFHAALQQQNMATRTIQRHVSNIETLAAYLAEPTSLREPKALVQLDADDFSSLFDDIAVYKKLLLPRSQGLCLPTSLSHFVDWAGECGHIKAEQVLECLELLQAERAQYRTYFRMSLAKLAEQGVHGLDPGMIATQGWRDAINPAL